MRTYTVKTIDDPDGTVYTLAPTEIEVGINRRLGDGPRPTPVVLHPDKPNVFIFNPGNFWDGPTHVRWDPDLGHFFADGWGGPFHWPLIGPIN
jgi:hypothetical protein